MADNVAITAGTGTNIATDDLAGVHYQRVKVSHGADGSATDSSDAAPFPSKLIGNQVTLTSRGGTITTGGTAQNAMGSNSSRRGYMIQNVSTADLWFNPIATAVQSQPSVRLSPGQSYESPPHAVPTTAISIIGATTGQAWAAWEW